MTTKHWTVATLLAIACGCGDDSGASDATTGTDTTAGPTSASTSGPTSGPTSGTASSGSTGVDTGSSDGDTSGSTTGPPGGDPCDVDPPADLSGFGIGDAMSHPPPTDGDQPYSPPGDWLPGAGDFVAVGQSFTDPVFGPEVTRLTDVHPGPSGSQIYVRNGFWSADGSLFMHHLTGCDSELVDAATGQVVAQNVPGCWRASFDPADPHGLYFPSGSALMRYDVQTAQETMVQDFGGTLESLGGSVDYIDRSGRWFVVNVAGTVQVWDRQDDVIYGGTLSGDQVGTGWVGISPDGSHLIVPGDFEFFSYAIDHDTQTVDTQGTLFWTLCGDHADIVTGSDGNTYLVAFECWSEAAIYRVDVTIPQTGDDDAGRAKQRSDNVMLVDLEFDDSGHISCVAGGRYRDWCFYSSTDSGDTFGDPGPWRPYKQEIIAMQVVDPFDVRRLAHHRSRSIGNSYQLQPRVSASWCGNVVGWVSNFGYDATDYADAYAIHLP